MAEHKIDQPHHPTGEDTLPVVRYTVAPGIHSQITLRTLPGAACTLRREGEFDQAHCLRLYADGDGIIRFHARPSAESEEIANAVIDYEVDGKVTRQPLQLRASFKPTPAIPAPPAENPKSSRQGTLVRPALSEKEALHLSDEETLKRGYPLRPDIKEAPKAFNVWRRAVSIPATFVKPHTVSHPDITHGKRKIEHSPESSSNWSGFELLRALKIGGPATLHFDEPYDWVTGTWHVPIVTSEFNTSTYSSLWIGLDGDGTSDLVQAGTEQESINISFTFFNITFSTYYGWTEFLPQQSTEQRITNFPINPGDEIFAEVWIGNPGSSPTLSGAFGVFLLENLTTSQYTSIYTPVGSTRVGGSEAVWIMERPTVGGNLPDLADYGSATMLNAYARKANSPRGTGYVPYQGARSRQITMFNASDTLSTVTPIDTYSMQFNWEAFH